MSHFIDKCSCGVVLAQCRCFDPAKTVRISNMPCRHSSEDVSPTIQNTEHVSESADIDTPSTPHSSELDEFLQTYYRNDRAEDEAYQKDLRQLIARERQKAVDDMIQKIREWNWYDGDIDVNQSLDDLLDDLSRKDDEATNSNKGEAE